MSGFINALDQHTKKSIGEKGHIQYGWSNDLRQKICQLYFQLVRSKDHSDLVREWRQILASFVVKEKERLEEFRLIIKLVANVRYIKKNPKRIGAIILI